jgi:hypothetical protein
MLASYNAATAQTSPTLTKPQLAIVDAEMQRSKPILYFHCRSKLAMQNPPIQLSQFEAAVNRCHEAKMKEYRQQLVQRQSDVNQQRGCR